MSGFPDLPSLPTYELKPLPPLIAPIPDKLLTLLLPIAAYWGLSMIFHWIDTRDIFPQYRLHTPSEVLKRNRVSRWQVVRDVVIQQVVQIVVGWVLGMTEPDDVYGKEVYDVAIWARRIRIAERFVPRSLAALGVNASALGYNLKAGYPVLAGAVLGGQYPATQLASAASTAASITIPGYASWELSLAWLLYWVVVPIVQFGVAILVMDTWQYFLHRAMHMNKWLYSTSYSPAARPLLILDSYLSCSSSQTLCTLRIRCALQSSFRGVPARHSGCEHRLQGGFHEHKTGDVPFHWCDLQDCR